MANKFVNHSLKQRSKWEENEDRTVEISVDELNQLHSANYFSKKKGKALFMLKVGKEIDAIQRKRKRVYESYEPNSFEEEKNGYRNKRTKTNEGNSKITEWLKVKKRRTDIADLNKSENDEENEDSRDNMSIDKNIQKMPNPFTKNNK